VAGAERSWISQTQARRNSLGFVFERSTTSPPRIARADRCLFPMKSYLSISNRE
jgi:hypothetical protein